MDTTDNTRGFPQARGRYDRVFVAMIGELEPQMDQWREGRISLPASYIEAHENFARADLDRLAKLGWRIWGAQMERDGWLDGMRFLVAVVENPDGGLLKIKWSDSGLWYTKSGTGAWLLCGQPTLV